jgi:hypothetical protein
MLVFLDPKDLIEILERQTPVSAEDLARLLLACSARLVLTRESVWELLPRGHKKLTWKQLVSSLDTIPHVFVRTVDIVPLEFREAATAFGSRRKPFSIAGNLLVNRWYDTIFSKPSHTFDEVYAKVQLDACVGMGLLQQVGLVVAVSDDRPRRRFIRDRLAAVLATEREYFGSARSYDTFRYGVIRTMASLPDPLPEPYEDFIHWLHEDASRVAGWRTAFETREEMRCDLGYRPRVGDISDLTHLQLLPYVDLITVDRTTAHFPRQANSRMGLMGPREYNERVLCEAGSAIAALN